ncbi:9860_t:CDS:1, partial [Rhizophagus irregularis]
SIVKGYTLSERYEEIPKVSDFSDSSETSEPSDSNARVKGPFLINDDDKTR